MSHHTYLLEEKLDQIVYKVLRHILLLIYMGEHVLLLKPKEDDVKFVII